MTDEELRQIDEMLRGHDMVEMTVDSEGIALLRKMWAEVERLQRWEKIVEEDIEASLRHFGDDRLADRFVESNSPIHQRIGMVIHCLINAASAAGGEK